MENEKSDGQKKQWEKQPQKSSVGLGDNFSVENDSPSKSEVNPTRKSSEFQYTGNETEQPKYGQNPPVRNDSGKVTENSGVNINPVQGEGVI